MRATLALFFLLSLFWNASAFAPTGSQPSPSSPNKPFSALSATTQPLESLTVAIVGGGPSGLLLAHRLVEAGAQVNLFESRPEPTSVQAGKAYALGVGRRGRTAIQSAQDVWPAVQKVGFASERFRLHISPKLSLKLRDANPNQEPSLLLFQNDLCAAMLQELKNKFDEKQLKLHFQSSVEELDLRGQSLRTDTNQLTSFDLVVGCDGVNSVVRKTIADHWADFKFERNVLKGHFKTIQLEEMPPKLDPTAVALLFPNNSSFPTTAFVEPTGNGGACVLLAGANITDPLLTTTTDVSTLETILAERYPLLQGADLELAAQQLLAIPQASQASSVQCNTYHCGHVAVLCGDAAHATGGVSGQGVNSALVDSAVLADILCEKYQALNKQGSIQAALLEYSERQVPEGHALYELSFPPPLKGRAKIFSTLRRVRDFIWKGRWGIGRAPLQTILTTSLDSFADIRRQRQADYGDQEFQDYASWKKKINALDAQSPADVSV